MRAPRRVVLVAANPAGALTGNERTSQRIAALLRRVGVDVDIARPDTPAPDTPSPEGTSPDAAGPDLLHAFHLRRSGPRALDFATQYRCPVVVSVTGTDLGLDLHDPSRGQVIRSVLSRVDGVACGHEEEATLARDLVRSGVPVVVVPKGVAPTEPAAPNAAAAGPGPLVLCVAHVRRVKRLDVAILAVRRLHVAGRRVRLAILGGVLEEAEATRLRKLVGEAAWIDVFRGSVEPSDVPGWLAAADVVLNTSDVEGGSNAVLEAMAAGRAVVASDIPGNAQYVGRDGTRGLLYPVSATGPRGVIHGLASCADALARLLDDPEARRRLGAAARDHVLAEHSPERERDALLGLYARVLASSRSA